MAMPAADEVKGTWSCEAGRLRLADRRIICSCTCVLLCLRLHVREYVSRKRVLKLWGAEMAQFHGGTGRNLRR